MKRVIAAILCIGILLGLSGCKTAQRIEKNKEYGKFSLTSEELAEINELRSDYDLGTLKDLRGNIAVALYFMSDDTSDWNGVSLEDFIANEIQPGLDFLEKEAYSHRVRLNFEIVEKSCRRYYGRVSVDLNNEYVTDDLIDGIADDLKFESDNEFYESLKNKYGGREVICITIFNKNGTSTGINPTRGDSQVDKLVEHSILFAHDYDSDHTEPVGSQASLVAANILYLYGAENLDSTESREAIAIEEYPSDIMVYSEYDISWNNIGDATAFYVGWTDKVPDVFYEDGWNE